MSHATTELARKLANLVNLGTIAQVDHSSARVRVDIAGRRSAWLPFPAEIGANFRRWRPLRVGTQVLVACPAGDPANAVIVQILYTAALPPPEHDGSVDVIAFDDGTTLRYDSGAHALTIVSAGTLDIRTDAAITVQAAAEVTVEAEGPVSITAPAISMVGTRDGATLTGSFRLRGDLDVDGSIHASGTIIDAGGNTANHSH